MGHKSVCLECYRVENLGLDLTNLHLGKCPLCSNQMIFINHSFRPPKKTDKKKWELVKFMISEGFPFHHVYQEGKSEYYKSESNNYVSYPKTLEEAKEWVVKYKDQRIKN
ncbi:hypothetical protein [Winogradskyella ursingii]|uniref:hypothetical protein n=1 Tax=Winogradskyella ursingii TaxID=2686079 RepID=UPI0015CB77D3|nr:hypothetical protein [Winogradskyella ursingii]